MPHTGSVAVCAATSSCACAWLLMPSIVASVRSPVEGPPSRTGSLRQTFMVSTGPPQHERLRLKAMIDIPGAWLWVILGLLAGWGGVALAVRALLGQHPHERRPSRRPNREWTT